MLLLVILVGGYAAMTVLMPSEEEETEEESKEFTVATVKEDNINKIVYTHKGSEITLERKDEKDEWVSPTDKNCPVNEYTVDAMLSALKEIKATRKIKKADVDEEAFGFKEPSLQITFTKKNGKEVVYTLGALNSVVDKYYFKMTGDDKAYLVDTTLYNSFDYDLLGLAEVEEYPSIGNQDVSDYSVTVDGKTKYFVDSKDAAHKKNDSEIPECVWKSGDSKSNLKKMDTDTADELIQAVIGLTNSECVSYNMTDKELKKYGLDNPKMTLTVNYTSMKSSDKKDEDGNTEDAKILDHSFTVYFGNTDEESGEYYVYRKGSKAIYTMNVSNVDKLKKAVTE